MCDRGETSNGWKLDMTKLGRKIGKKIKRSGEGLSSSAQIIANKCEGII